MSTPRSKRAPSTKMPMRKRMACSFIATPSAAPPLSPEGRGGRNARLASRECEAASGVQRKRLFDLGFAQDELAYARVGGVGQLAGRAVVQNLRLAGIQPLQRVEHHRA